MYGSAEVVVGNIRKKIGIIVSSRESTPLRHVCTGSGGGWVQTGECCGVLRLKISYSGTWSFVSCAEDPLHPLDPLDPLVEKALPYRMMSDMI